MICASYKGLIIPENLKNPNWEKALVWLKEDSWKNLPLRKTEIDGEKLFVRRSSGMSKIQNECRYESHRFYADIQMLIKGSELVLVCPDDGMKVVEPYSEEKDIEFFSGEPEHVHRIVLGFPLVIIFFPWDIHMPSLALDNKPSEIDKIVLKVAL